MSYMNHVQGTMMSTNQVGYIIVIAWVARDLWQRKPTSPLGLRPRDSVGLLP